MKLKYKISMIITLFSLFIVIAILSIYSLSNYQVLMKNEQNKLVMTAVDSANNVKQELVGMLKVVKTITSGPIVSEELEKSNNYYETLSQIQRDKEINELNNKWLQAQSNDDPFIASYMKNKLANYFKSQYTVLPNLYGEIFITNRYGVLVATSNKLSTLKHSHKYWWKECYNDGEGKAYFDDRGFDESVQGYVIGITVPIKKNGEIIGIIKANINIIGALNSILKNYNRLNKGVLHIVRTKGLIVLEEGLPPLSTSINSKLLEALKNRETRSTIIKEYNKEKIFAYSPIVLTLGTKDVGFGGAVIKSQNIKSNEGEIWHTVVSYDKKIALSEFYKNNRLIIYIGLVFITLSALISFIIGRLIAKPIDKLSSTAYRIGKGEHNLKAEVRSNDEVGALAKSFNTMLDKLKFTMASRDDLLKEIQKREAAEIKIKEQEKIMIAQSRHAAMGEMINMLAHQWRQPISIIAMGMNNILASIEFGTLNEETLKSTSNNVLNKTKELSQTINSFGNFFKPNRTKEEIFIEDILKETFSIIEKTLEYDNIQIRTEFSSSHKIETYSKELMQVFINIIKNAKEALIASNKEQKEINISVKESTDKVIINICDNADGVSEDIIDNIFDPYFTTKDEENGAGLGLYISKTIIEKHLQGMIAVKNIENGTCFEMKLPFKLREIT